MTSRTVKSWSPSAWEGVSRDATPIAAWAVPEVRNGEAATPIAAPAPRPRKPRRLRLLLLILVLLLQMPRLGRVSDGVDAGTQGFVHRPRETRDRSVRGGSGHVHALASS